MRYDVAKYCAELINGLQHSNNRENFSPATYIKEHRTIGMTLPRQSGKTFLLNHIRHRESSLMFVPSKAIKNGICPPTTTSIVIFSDIGRLVDQFRGMYIRGLKYTCFLIDEPDSMTQVQKEQLFELIDFLYRAKMLSDDFFVLKLGS
jgi:hypothetical protein